MTPFIANTIDLNHDPQYDLLMATFYTDPSVCRLVCGVCEMRKWKDRIKFLDDDEFLLELQRYSLRGVELFQIRGGECCYLYGELEKYLKQMAEVAPIRLGTSGIRPQILSKFKTIVSGFRLDIKIPLLDYYTDEDLELCKKCVGVAKIVPLLRKGLIESVDLIDSMQFTYYTSSTWHLFNDDQRASTLRYLSNRKGLFIVDEDLKKHYEC